MSDEHDSQQELFSTLSGIDIAQILISDLHDDLPGKVARFRRLSDLAEGLGSSGTLFPGGQTAYSAWIEARSSYVHGNFVATVMLSQSLAEHVLAAYLHMAWPGEDLPIRIAFRETLNRCIAREVISPLDGQDLRRLMDLRNPLSHHRPMSDPSNLTRRLVDEQMMPEEHLAAIADFAISVAFRLMCRPAFRVGKSQAHQSKLTEMSVYAAYLRSGGCIVRHFASMLAGGSVYDRQRDENTSPARWAFPSRIGDGVRLVPRKHRTNGARWRTS